MYDFIIVGDEIMDAATTIVIIVWILSLGRSVMIMFGTSIFRKAYRNEKQAYIPVLNLFSMLEIGDQSPFFGILFFVPFLNLLPLVAMGYGIGNAFKCDMGYKLGLMFLPIIFYPLLFMSDKQYKNNSTATFQAFDSTSADDLDLEGHSAFVNDGATEHEEDDIDSIFKRDIDMMDKAPTYRANRNESSDDEAEEVDFDDFAPIKKVELEDFAGYEKPDLNKKANEDK